MIHEHKTRCKLSQTGVPAPEKEKENFPIRFNSWYNMVYVPPGILEKNRNFSETGKTLSTAEPKIQKEILKQKHTQTHTLAHIPALK